jgi:threonine/homoserine/homoserine lactone efflux protein
MTAALLAFTAASVLIVLLPGPDTLVVVRGLLRGGRRESIRTAIGVLSGLFVWVVAAAFGLSAVVRASHTGYTLLRAAGAVYLIWLGVRSLRARMLLRDDVVVPRPRRRALLGSGFGAGLATDLLNPKVGVFFVSFLPGFLPAGYGIATASLLFGAIFIVETAIYFVVLIGLATRVTAWMTNTRVRRRLDRLTGVVLIGFGVRLATET